MAVYGVDPPHVRGPLHWLQVLHKHTYIGHHKLHIHSYLDCAWYAFPFEALEIFTYSLPQAHRLNYHLLRLSKVNFPLFG